MSTPNTHKSNVIRLPEFHPVRSSSTWKMGLDIGRTTTVYQELYLKAGTAQPILKFLPTLIGYPGKGMSGDPRWRSLVEIGEAAARRRDHLEVFSPLDAEASRRPAVLLEFAGALAREMGCRRTGKPWGVLAVPLDAGPDHVRELRTMGGEIFERLLLVEEHLLIGMGVLRDPASRAAVVDIGARSVRAALVGTTPGQDDRRVSPHGGDAVDAVLKRLLLEKFPDLVLTDLTITHMKEQLGSVAPAHRTAQVKVELGTTHRTIDVTGIVREACETLVPEVVGALRDVLGSCPGDLAPAFQEKIFLTGGGACMPGLPERVQSELEREGFHHAVVHSVARPRMVLALGALKWALVTPDGSWEVPLFAFRPTG